MAGENISAINGMYNPYSMYNNYINYAGLSTMYDIDGMSMNGSLFGGGYMPFMPSFGGGMNYDSYRQYYKDNLNFTSDMQLLNIQNQRSNELKINSPYEGIQKAAAVLNEKIVANEQEQIQGALQNYITAVKHAYPDDSDTDVINRATSMYKQIYNASLTDDIRKYGSNSFTHGLLKAVTFGWWHNKTAEQNISDITGQPVSRKENLKEIGGLAVGGSAVAGVGLLAASNLGWLAKVPKVGWIYGGILAAGAAIAAIFGSK